MKILILGGHGFIGHNIAIQLKKLGHAISIVDCHHRYGQFFEKEFISVLNQKMLAIGTHDFHYGSVGDTVFIESVFALVRPEIVINLATYSNINYVKNNVIDATENMIVSTAVILDLCVKYQISRFVFASSSMVYGSVSDETVPQLEDNICNPLTLYGSYKLQCEQMCKIWNAEHGLEYVILRPSSLYGIRDLTVRIISRMATEAIGSNRITIAQAENTLDFSYVDDVAAAFVFAATNRRCANEIYNCTRGAGRKIIEAAEIIARRFGARIIIKPNTHLFPKRGSPNSDKLRLHTDWAPTINIEQGIPMYLDWLVQQNYLHQE